MFPGRRRALLLAKFKAVMKGTGKDGEEWGATNIQTEDRGKIDWFVFEITC